MSRERRVAIYARCSTSNSDQNPEVQLTELRSYCAARGWTVVEELSDCGYSGASEKRPGLKNLQQLAKSRRVDAVVVTKLDRLFRSTKHLVVTLSDWSDLGVEFVSIKDQIDLTTASGRLMMQVVSAFAEFERDLISERTKAGLHYARANGSRLGRPRSTEVNRILSLRDSGLSQREIAEVLGCSKGAVYRAIQSAPKTSPEKPSTGQGETGG